MILLENLKVRVWNDVIEAIVESFECQEEIKVANDYWRCVQSKSQWLVTVGSGKMLYINTFV